MGKTVIRHFSMPKELSRLLNLIAKKRRMNYSEYVRFLIRQDAKEVENGNYRKKT